MFNVELPAELVSVCVRENPNEYIQIFFVYLDIQKSSRKAKCL